MPLGQFSATVERLYAAAAAPAAWGDALRAVEDLSGAAGAVIGFVPIAPAAGTSAGPGGFVLSGRFSAEQCAEYARDYAPICPRLALAARRPDLDFGYDSLLMSDAELDRDPTYRWFERVSGVRYYLGTRLSDVGGYHVNTSVQRTRAQGHVQRADLELFARLRPHIDQALKLSNLIGTFTAGQRLALQALEGLAHGVVALDVLGRILFANPAAAAILAAGDGIGATQGRLTAARAADTRAIERLVRANRAGERRSGWLRLPRPSGRADYLLFSAPLLIDDDLLPGLERPHRLVAILDPTTRPALDARMLSTLFALTPKEAQVAARLAQGHELSAIAVQLGITSETARSHLKSIFRKLEVNRQQEVVNLLLSLAPIGGAAA